jgi:tetratricopeptide (TPR) repeat protein
MSMLAGIGKCLGEAEETLQEIYDWHKEHHGPAHQYTVSSAFKLGYCGMRAGHYTEAVAPLQEAFKGRKKGLGRSDEDTLRAAHIVATCLGGLGRWADEASICEFIHEVETELHGPISSPALVMLKYRATAVFRQGHQGVQTNYRLWDKAAALFQECYEGFQVRYGDYNRETLSALACVADCKEGPEATQLWTRVIAAHRKQFGPKHRNTLVATFYLAHSLLRDDDCIEARRLFQSTYAEFEELSGPVDQKTLGSLDGLGLACYRLKDYYAACDAYQKLYNRRRECDGPLHRYTLRTLYWIATCLRMQANTMESEGQSQAKKRQKKHSEAKRLYKQVYKGCKETLGSLHQETEELRNRLRRYDETCGDMSDWSDSLSYSTTFWTVDLAANNSN